MAEAFAYQGSELELFAGAKNWKQYQHRAIAPLIRGRVLEVGAGMGNITALFRDVPRVAWTCLEPDLKLAGGIQEQVAMLSAGSPLDVRMGGIASVAPDESYDTILYIDVLEHIEADLEELREAARHLTHGGRLVVLAPAHNTLFTPFDLAVGHFRRYNARTLSAIGPPDLRLEKCDYIDSVGLLASVGNRLLLRQSMPTPKQIAVWDRLMVPISRWLDPVFGYHVGKSILAVWHRPA